MTGPTPRRAAHLAEALRILAASDVALHAVVVRKASSIPTASIYFVLYYLEDHGLVSSVLEPPERALKQGGRRRMYSITARGRERLALSPEAANG